MAIARVNGMTPSRCRQISFEGESHLPSRTRIPDSRGCGRVPREPAGQPAAVGNARRFRSIVFGLFFTMKDATRTCRRERRTGQHLARYLALERCARRTEAHLLHFAGGRVT